jgi:hypothetical protein
VFLGLSSLESLAENICAPPKPDASTAYLLESGVPKPGRYGPLLSLRLRMLQPMLDVRAFPHPTLGNYPLLVGFQWLGLPLRGLFMRNDVPKKGH